MYIMQEIALFAYMLAPGTIITYHFTDIMTPFLL